MRKIWIELAKISLIGLLVITTLSIGFYPQPAEAALLPSTVLLEAQGIGSNRASSLDKIQALLESKLIRQRLEDLGLSESDILARLGQLSDEQIHQVATQLESLHPGGDGLGLIVVLLVIAILVVILLQVSGHKVIITK